VHIESTRARGDRHDTFLSVSAMEFLRQRIAGILLVGLAVFVFVAFRRA
jgi:succinate dehydrogenase hydrophobic anchor subunit